MLTMNGFLVSMENPNPLPAPTLAHFLAIFRRDFAKRDVAEVDDEFKDFGEPVETFEESGESFEEFGETFEFEDGSDE